MKAHQWFIEHRPDFTARALDPAEERAFRTHLETCADCRAAIAELERELGWLPMGINPVMPPAGFTDRVVREVTVSPRRANTWWRPVLAAAAVFMAVVLWQVDRSRMARELAAVRDTLSVVKLAGKVVQMPIRMAGVEGGMVIFADEKTHRWNVVVHGLPPAPVGERYTFWFVTDNGMVRGPEIDLDEKNPAVMTLDMPPGQLVIKGGALTMEPNQRSERPLGRELAHFEL